MVQVQQAAGSGAAVGQVQHAEPPSSADIANLLDLTVPTDHLSSENPVGDGNDGLAMEGGDEEQYLGYSAFTMV